jgi:hypothetical protein
MRRNPTRKPKIHTDFPSSSPSSSSYEGDESDVCESEYAFPLTPLSQQPPESTQNIWQDLYFYTCVFVSVIGVYGLLW